MVKLGSLLSLALLAVTPASATLAPHTQGHTMVEFNPARTVELRGAIAGPGMFDVIDRIIELSETPGNIDIVIASPGGSIVLMNIIVKAMEVAQYNGANIRCAVPVLAASAAFTVFAACDERYAFDNSLLLFHPARVGSVPGPVTQKQATELGQDLKEADQDLRDYLLPKLGMDPVLFEKAFQDEKFWKAKNLAKVTTNFVIIVDTMVGIERLFSLNPKGGTDNKTENPAKKLVEGADNVPSTR